MKHIYGIKEEMKGMLRNNQFLSISGYSIKNLYHDMCALEKPIFWSKLFGIDIPFQNTDEGDASSKG